MNCNELIVKSVFCSAPNAISMLPKAMFITRLPAILVLLAIASPASAQTDATAVQQVTGAMPGRVRVKLRVDAAQASQILAPAADRFGITSIRAWINPALLHSSTMPYKSAIGSGSTQAIERGLARIIEVAYSATDAPEAVATRLASLPDVEYAEPVYPRRISYVPNDPYISVQWYLEHIHVFEAWETARADSSIMIAIVDTGIDMVHPDLADAIYLNPGESGMDELGRNRKSNGIDDDRNGLIDDWHGYDFGGTDGYKPDNDPTPRHYHGTHVAGIAAARGDNNIGIVGIAYGATLLPVKISDDARDSDPVLTAGFDGIAYAADMGARVINCSWGGPGRSLAEQEVIDYATARGSLVVAAAGNEGMNTAIYPASYRGVLSVASVMKSDKRSIFSNFNTNVGITAPGDEIYSTVPTTSLSNGYMSASGTSMATPVVSGTAALVASKYPELGPEQIAAVLRATSDDVSEQNPGERNLLGRGRINVERAVQIGPNTIAAAITGYDIMDPNDDGAIDAGETIELRLRVRNILQPASDVVVALETVTDSVSIIGSEDSFGQMSTGEERESHAGTFRLTIPATVPVDYRLPLSITVRNNDSIIETRQIELIVNPNYATTEHNRITATFTGNGRIGFNDFPGNSQGRGFQVDSSGSLLAEGGLLIGVTAGRLADVVRSENGLQSQGLRTVAPYRVELTSDMERGSARFNDDHLHDMQRIGLDVSMMTIEYNGVPEQENQVLVLYTITNTRPYPLENLHCALYLDWDIGPMGSGNRVDFDSEHRMGYISNVRDSKLPLAGAMLLSNQPMNFTAIDNASPPMTNGFLQIEKWGVISGGIQRERSNVGDASMIIGAGPITLAPGADTVVAFSLMGGKSLTELQSSVDHARQLFARLGYTPGEPIFLPRQLQLTVTGPNPFSTQTHIEFRLPNDDVVALELYNAAGQRLAVLASGTHQRGIYEVNLPADNLADGPYLILLRTTQQTLVQKLIHLKQ
jgi:subtilisin family serine protease